MDQETMPVGDPPAGQSRQWQDWVSLFMAFTDGLPSPEHLRLWGGISALAGALERRVFVRTARKVLYPNMFTLLVTPPGIGKSVCIENIQELWFGTRLRNGSKFFTAPNNVTKAALIDHIAKADRKIMAGGTLIEYHSLLVASSEFGVLVPAHDLEFLSVLNDIYDNPRAYRESRRTLGREIDIHHPQLNIIAGTQPAYLANLLPEEAWGQGFMSRVIMVYAGEGPTPDLFAEPDPRTELFQQLLVGMTHISSMMGCMEWSDEAMKEMQDWARAKLPPVPEHSKLTHYCARRVIHALKLCMISCASRTGKMLIELEDVMRAKNWLLGAELTMPDVFRAMAGRSDSQVIDDLHYFMYKLYMVEKKPIHEARVWDYLKNYVPSDRIGRIIETCLRANIIARKAGTGDGSGEAAMYYPRPKNEHGME